jgi:hypothetical protein
MLRNSSLALRFVALVLLVGPAFPDDDVSNRGSGAASGVIGGSQLAQKLARIIPGRTSKAQVKSLLGAPWRIVQYNDRDTPEDEIWEYRAIDLHDTCGIHIEFDHHDVVRVMARIPDRARGSNQN